MGNFSFLTEQPNYALFATACNEAEAILPVSPTLSALACRKALELAVKWVYAADSQIDAPYQGNLSSLIHHPPFRQEMDERTWGKIRFVMSLGNLAAHEGKVIPRRDTSLALSYLFEFVEWIDYCYGESYIERRFDERLIPSEAAAIDPAALKQREALLTQKDSEIERLKAEIEKMSQQLTAAKPAHQKERSFAPGDISEYETRRRYIDLDLKLLGWTFDEDLMAEFPVEGMAGVPGQKGFADYVLFGKDGLPLAVVEAKKSCKDPNAGKQQAKLYADCLEARYHRRPMMFTTNGFETFFWDDKTAPQRPVSGVFSKDDLQKLMNRRGGRKALGEIAIDDRITDRYYQKEAIRAVCDNFKKGFRRSLLVMATGTGKTRTASSLVDVLSRGGWITNVLFLADRTALVRQAKDDFHKHLPDMSLCNLVENKDDRNARIVFSTYPTMLNAIDSVTTKDGRPVFTPAHFDLIIIDEAHRSIFKKYRAIFDYFDAMLVGLTATPKTDVDRNTYEFFEMEHGVPTYAYDYDTAVYKDHVLVPYYNIETTLKFTSQGIVYDELSEEDKARYEEDFAEDEELPEIIESSKINDIVFNQDTVDRVLQDLMELGARVAGGDRLGKTIIFAQNKRHAQYIVERFDKLYPHLNGGFCKRVVCGDDYAQTLITDFKQPEREPVIAVSVDMLDTGIDVPEIVNLVFFKEVRSKTKFWQMIGRGTRLCQGLEVVDAKDGAYSDKRRFFIFDYLGNFDFFREKQEGFESKETMTLSESVFVRRARLVKRFQDSTFAEERFQTWRGELVDTLCAQVQKLNPELVSVRLQRRHVEKFSVKEAFVCLGDPDMHDLEKAIAPLVYMEETDEYAKRFDNFMYGMMLMQLDALPGFKKSRKQLCTTAQCLEKRASIPQVMEKLPLIQTINTEEFWAAGDLLEFENVRKELRSLIKFIVDEGSARIVYTMLQDEVLKTQEGKPLDPAYDFADYRLKVNRYIEEHRNHIAIHKLRNNVPLTETDYAALLDILTKELGSEEDYRQAFGDTPMGLLVRKVARLEHDAAMQAFSDFINDQSLNQQQIVFVKKIIDYVERNGYVEDLNVLTNPPFDKPVGFIKLFDAKRRQQIVSAVDQVRKNAVMEG